MAFVTVAVIYRFVHRRKRNSFHLGSGKPFLENVVLEMTKEMGGILVELYVRKGI